jgi:hypothetical protein
MTQQEKLTLLKTHLKALTSDDKEILLDVLSRSAKHINRLIKILYDEYNEEAFDEKQTLKELNDIKCDFILDLTEENEYN